MGRKRHTPEQIITALREAEVGLARGKSVKLISRELGITEQTYYRWLPPRLVTGASYGNRAILRPTRWGGNAQDSYVAP